MAFQSSSLQDSVARACTAMAILALVGCSGSDSNPPVDPAPTAAQWRWMAPESDGASISDVWGPSADNLFATASGGVVMRYDGTSWRKSSTPTAANLNAIWGTSANHLVAVGDDGVILVYDGSVWTQQASDIDVYFLDVWGTAANDVFAVGLDRTVVHYDGVSWTTMTTEKFGPALNSVWGSSSTNVYATGVGRNLLRYNGTSWDVEVTPATFALSAIWGTGPDEIFAVGGNGAAIWFDGVSWSTIDRGSSLFSTAVWGTDGGDVYAVGQNGSVFHWDGSAWDAMVCRSTQELDAVYGVDGRVFTVGKYGTILELAGGEWEHADEGFTVDLHDVWTDAAGDAFAVGNSGTILRLQNGAWETMASGTTQHLRSVHGNSSNGLIAVGRGGVVLRFDGASWTPSVEGPGFDLHDVYVLPSGDAYAVGAGGLILRSFGSSWVDASIPGVVDSLLGVWGPSANDVYVVGAQSRALHWNGVGWKLVAIDIARVNNYHAVHGVSGDDFYVAAEFLQSATLVSVPDAPLHAGGLIYHWNGTSWEAPYQDPIHDLLSIWAASPEKAFASGDASSILVGSPAGFLRISQLSNLPFNVNGVWGASASDVLVVGDNGTIARYSR